MSRHSLPLGSAPGKALRRNKSEDLPATRVGPGLRDYGLLEQKIVTNFKRTDMFKMNFRSICGCLLTVFMAGALATACYDDSELRSRIDNLSSQLTQLQTLVNSLQNDDAVTAVTPNADGSYTITFKKSGAVTIRSGKDGEPGKDGSIIDVVKGKDTYTFVFSDGTSVILPRYSEIRVLSFEDADYRGASETTAYWTSLVDDPQYGGPILYGSGCSWADENNTFLGGSVLAYDATTWSGGLSGGGIALSNYGNGMLAGADHTRQLEVYVRGLDGAGRSACGAGGSDNFAIVYDGGQWGSNPAALVMADKTARQIESLQITNTAYVLNALMNGNDYSAPMASDGYFKVTATGYLNDEVTGAQEFYLAHGGVFTTGWTSWNLSELGTVDKVVFSVSGSPDLYGDYGFNAPAYFAIDDVAVRVYPD